MDGLELMPGEAITESDLDRLVEQCERRVDRAETLLRHAESELARQAAACGEIEVELIEAQRQLLRSDLLLRTPRGAD